jgi:hypothetical protein
LSTHPSKLSRRNRTKVRFQVNQQSAKPLALELVRNGARDETGETTRPDPPADLRSKLARDAHGKLRSRLAHLLFLPQ